MLDVIFKFAAGDLAARGSLSGKDDALDGVMAGINILGEELEAYVAENKRAQQALSESEALLRAIFDSVQDGIILAESQSQRFRMVNASICRMLGYSPDEFLNLGVEGIHPEESLPYVLSQFERLAKAEIGIAPNIPMKRKDGSVFYADANAGPMMLNGVACLVGVFRDITERKRAEQALAKSEALIRSVFDAVQDAIILADAESRRLKMVNASTCRMLGYSREELLDMRVEDVHPEADIAYVLSQFEQLAKGKIDVAPNLPMKRKDGTVFYADANVGHMTIDGVAFLVGVLRDITNRRQAEEKMRAAALYARSLSEAGLDPLATISVAGKILDVNEAAELATGVPRESLIGSDFSAYFTEPDKAHAAYQEAFTKGSVRNYPLTMRQVSGKLTEVLYNASVYRNEKGEVAGVLAVARDITERNRAEQAEELARRDGLTGLYNHRTFYSMLKDEIVRAQRFKRPVSLLMLDIDHFKRVNDTHGHRAGDAILKGLSDLLMKQARAVDRACRYGGEEFTVILPEADTAVAINVAERMRAEVERQSFYIDGGKTVAITISIGVATYPQQVDSLEALVKAADDALYAAKQGGRNRVCRCETEMAGADSSA
jgi:diguanylate cyclase (GGDEF)-like protein/PAS domain S-box-containing protein